MHGPDSPPTADKRGTDAPAGTSVLNPPQNSIAIGVVADPAALPSPAAGRVRPSLLLDFPALKAQSPAGARSGAAATAPPSTNEAPPRETRRRSMPRARSGRPAPDRLPEPEPERTPRRHAPPHAPPHAERPTDRHPSRHADRFADFPIDRPADARTLRRESHVPPLDDTNAGFQAAPRLDPAVWHRVLTHVRRTHPSLNRTWFETLVPRQLDNGVVHVTCETLPQLNFLTGKCQQPFTAAAQGVTNRLNSVVMFHCEQITPGGGVFDERQEQLALSPDYTFDNFIVGPGNQLAHAASSAVAEQPGAAYNPLFIHGGVGLGKTHLLQAICQRVLERRPQARILYLSCDSFINQFMTAVEAGDMNNFRFKFRSADMLVVDDIHFFGGRERTQEEFFHTFNTLQQAGRQIVLSADAPPNEIPELEERLISRFNQGLVARVEKPCYETRVAILRKKSRMRGLDVPDDVICYVAARVESNTRELEGAINKLQGLSLLCNSHAGNGSGNGHGNGQTHYVPGRIDLDLARQALGDGGEADGDRRITIQHILDAVTSYYGVKVSDLQSKKRNKSIAFPRQVCMYLARRHTRYSLEEIGGYFGGRDHTTVLHGVRTITRQVGEDPEVQRQVLSLDNQLTSGG